MLELDYHNLSPMNDLLLIFSDKYQNGTLQNHDIPQLKNILIMNEKRTKFTSHEIV